MRSLCASRRPHQAMPLAARSAPTHPASHQARPAIAAQSQQSPAHVPRRTYAKSQAPIIGIDLGTTYSCVAVAEGDGADPLVLENAEGQRTTPSVVAFPKEGQILVGSTAKRQAVVNPQRTIYASKRLIGRRYKDLTPTELRSFNYKVVEDDDGMAAIDVEGTVYTPAEVAAHVLRKMKQTAELRLSVPISEAVVTVPAYFSDAQRLATKKAAEIAGLKIQRIINEPTAAALAYGVKATDDGHTVAVYDLGGGTFDISVLEINSGVFEVRSTAGDTYLGGEDFDTAIANYLVEECKRIGVDPTGDLIQMQRLREVAEKTKCELSSAMNADATAPYIGKKADGSPVHLSVTLSRAKVDAICAPLIERTLAPIKAAMKDAQMRPNEVDQVILVGGMTRMPKVVETVRSIFGREPFRGVNPDEAVAAGAAIQGSIMKSGASDLILLDVVPFSIGVKLADGTFCHIVPRNTPIPLTRKATFTTSVDNQTVIELDMYQGERKMARDNKFLGHFEMRIPPTKKGTPVDITLEIDVDGVISVSASAQQNKFTFGNLKLNQAPARASSPPRAAPKASVAEPPVRETITVVTSTTTTMEAVYEDVRGAISMRVEQVQLLSMDRYAQRNIAAGATGSGVQGWRCPVCGLPDCKFYG